MAHSESGQISTDTAGAADPLAFLEARKELASRYLVGDGIEIGPLHQPLAVPPTARVRYVDRFGVEQLREHYPELSGAELVEPDIIDDGEKLALISDASLDFVIANHFIEHCENTIAALEAHVRVLKPGGILYLAVPDKRETFDIDRPVTPLEHVVRDFVAGPGWAREAHYEEWSELVEKALDPRRRARELMDGSYSIHFHVWTPEAFLELLLHCTRELSFAFEIEAFQRNGFEFIALLRKTEREAEVDPSHVASTSH
jgi:SAM-dependent methyltransferase